MPCSIPQLYCTPLKRTLNRYIPNCSLLAENGRKYFFPACNVFHAVPSKSPCAPHISFWHQNQAHYCAVHRVIIFCSSCNLGVYQYFYMASRVFNAKSATWNTIKKEKTRENMLVCKLAMTVMMSKCTSCVKLRKKLLLKREQKTCLQAHHHRQYICVPKREQETDREIVRK